MIWVLVVAGYLAVACLVGAGMTYVMTQEFGNAEPEGEDYMMGGLCGLFWPLTAPIAVMAWLTKRTFKWIQTKLEGKEIR